MGLRGIMIGAHGVVGSRGRQCSTEKANSDSVASCYTDGQLTALGYGWGLDNMGKCSNHIVFFMCLLAI